MRERTFLKVLLGVIAPLAVLWPVHPLAVMSAGGIILTTTAGCSLDLGPIGDLLDGLGGLEGDDDEFGEGEFDDDLDDEFDDDLDDEFDDDEFDDDEFDDDDCEDLDFDGFCDDCFDFDGDGFCDE